MPPLEQPEKAADEAIAASPADSVQRSSGDYTVTVQPSQLRIKFDSDTKHLRAVRLAIEQFARDAGFDDKGWADVGLAVNEAVANIIRHAYHSATPMPIDLTAERTPSGITIELRDWGHGEVPTHKALPTVQATDYVPEPGGLGLICMKSLMDEVTFIPQQPGMLLRMSRAKSKSGVC